MSLKIRKIENFSRPKNLEEFFRSFNAACLPLKGRRKFRHSFEGSFSWHTLFQFTC
uniref:Uncharacterized protein n=1 Tax=Meloidogyne enterolobii TaxID=390850 RepID=A0A6V7X2T0_MELEN|nr:unnamed protein product [Meloidogyne enterolobii]